MCRSAMELGWNKTSTRLLVMKVSMEDGNPSRVNIKQLLVGFLTVACFSPCRVKIQDICSNIQRLIHDERLQSIKQAFKFLEHEGETQILKIEIQDHKHANGTSKGIPKELVPRPDQVMIITLKWIYKVKLDELGGVLKNKANQEAKGKWSGSSEGSGTTPEVPDEPKDNSAVVAEKQAGYVQTNLTLSSAELEIQSMVDVPIHQEDLVVQRTPLIDPVISMVTEKTASTPTPPTTQAHVQMCSTSCWKDISRGV
ncbi:hypothetical protein Tco_0053916 [Tanacetum coccineum]